MKPEEALEVLNQKFKPCVTDEWEIALNVAIRAVEKEIERPWRKENRGHVEYTAVCPCCGYATVWSDVDYLTFCPECGQKLGGVEECQS